MFWTLSSAADSQEGGIVQQSNLQRLPEIYYHENEVSISMWNIAICWYKCNLDKATITGSMHK